METENQQNTTDMDDKKIEELVEEKLKDLLPPETRKIISKNLIQHKQMFKELAK